MKINGCIFDLKYTFIIEIVVKTFKSKQTLIHKNANHIYAFSYLYFLLYMQIKHILCNNCEIILTLIFLEIPHPGAMAPFKTNTNFEKRRVLLHSTQNCTLTHLYPRVLSLSNLCNY